MLTPWEECRTLCSHQLVNLCLEFIMLPCSKAFTDIVHIAIWIQPLLVCQTQYALNKICTPLLNRTSWIVSEEHWFDWNNKRLWNSAFHKTIPSKVININRNWQESQGGEGAVYHGPLTLIEEICLNHISQLGQNICLVQDIHDGLNWFLELEHPPWVSASCEVFWVLVFVPTLWAFIDNVFLPKR